MSFQIIPKIAICCLRAYIAKTLLQFHCPGLSAESDAGGKQLQLRLDRQNAEEFDSEPLPESRIKIRNEGLRTAIDQAMP